MCHHVYEVFQFCCSQTCWSVTKVSCVQGMLSVLVFMDMVVRYKFVCTSSVVDSANWKPTDSQNKDHILYSLCRCLTKATNNAQIHSAA